MAFRDRDNKDRSDRGDRGGDRGDRDGGFKPRGRSRARPAVDLTFDYKDPDTLRQFITEHGRIIPSRVSRLSAKQQRDLKTQIKRARMLALLPVGTKHFNYEEMGSRRG
ncbi:MAG: 30S ribosomal protein S18 [Oligoflexia bacterium]|nr:30S ribosomal protein S18 [Oligoflexia bacterium]